MNIQTFSIAGRSADGTQLGVAVASKFLAVGAYVPAARAEVGVVATQALGNLELKTRGLDMLADGVPVSELFEKFFAGDPYKESRQAGIVDANGRAATYTGDKCMPWAGGYAEHDPSGSFAIQGNCLAGPEVIDAMVAAWRESGANMPLSRRLLHTLSIGQDAGGDPRGKQAAALLVVGKGQGYGGLSDVAVDLRSDDSPNPIGELQRMLDLHDLYFGKTPEAELLGWDKTLIDEVRTLLQKLGYASGDLMSDLERWMGVENYEERWHDDRLDPVVLAQLRQAAR